jgi:HAMP domain-containing protein
LIVGRRGQARRGAHHQSLGNMEVPDFHARSRDEIGVLANSFNRMKKSVVQAMKMLEE